MSRRTQKNVGVVGLGIIGQRVAECLRRRGFRTFVWNRTPHPFPNFVGSPAELAELCDFIQIFVSDDDVLMDMVGAIKASLHGHHIVMAHSTVAPHTMRAAAEIVDRRGAQLLDAPFTGSKGAAEKGELVYYVGGDDAAIRRARPVLAASSKEIVEIGEIGQATTIKVATNMVTAATVQAAAEALALVNECGLPLAKFAEAMRSNGSNSGTLTMKLPKMLDGDFEPHFSVKHMLKDVQIASRLAQSYGLTLGVTEVAREALAYDAGEGHADDDYSSVVRVFFPEGVPGRTAPEPGSEEQATLNGLEERPAEVVADALPDRSEQVESTSVERFEPIVLEEAPAPEIAIAEVHQEDEIVPAEIRDGQENGNAPVARKDVITTKAAAAPRMSEPEPEGERLMAKKTASPKVAPPTSEAEPEEERRNIFSRIIRGFGDY